MRARVSTVVKSIGPRLGLALGLGLVLWAQPPRAQADREFVFADSDGHLVLRFAGSGSAPLEPDQLDEVSNAEFSSMVHDRLRADLLFEAERQDSAWSAAMEPRLAGHVARTGEEFTDIRVDCRAASCRVVMEQAGDWDVAAHRPVLEAVQDTFDAFIAAHLESFEPAFLITAYYQQAERPHIKAFLRRVERAEPADTTGHCLNGSDLCYGQHPIERPEP